VTSSVTTWPSKSFWPVRKRYNRIYLFVKILHLKVLAHRHNVKVGGVAVTENRVVDIALDSGVHVTQVGPEFEAVQEYVTQNFMKVQVKNMSVLYYK